MKTTLTILLFVLLSIGTTSCNLNATEDPVQPPAPDPVKVLEDQVESERQHRLDAELQAEEEARLRERWELAAIGLGILAIIGFFAGTTIGSRGKRHAAVVTA